MRATIFMSRISHNRFVASMDRSPASSSLKYSKLCDRMNVTPGTGASHEIILIGH